jgi:hypothetical protein
MDTNRKKSITLFAIIGISFIFILIFVFIIQPRRLKNPSGSLDLVLGLPVQEWSLRYAENGIVPFCQNGNEGLGIEVEEDSNVYSSSDGIVSDITGDVITIEVDSSTHILYHPVSNFRVFKGDYVAKGDSMGRITDGHLYIKVKNLKNKVYECPYVYFDEFSKSVLDSVDDVMGYDIDMCECDSLNY